MFSVFMHGSEHGCSDDGHASPFHQGFVQGVSDPS